MPVKREPWRPKLMRKEEISTPTFLITSSPPLGTWTRLNLPSSIKPLLHSEARVKSRALASSHREDPLAPLQRSIAKAHAPTVEL